jgi:hypothetical protein
MVDFVLPRHAYVLRHRRNETLHITDRPNPAMPIVFRNRKSAENGRRNLANNMPMRRMSMESWSVRPVYIRRADESEMSQDILLMFDWHDVKYKVSFDDDMLMADVVRRVVVVD